MLSDMSKAARLSYGVMVVALVLIAWLHLGVLALTVLFGYFALDRLRFGSNRHPGFSKHFAVALYAIIIVVATYLLVYFSRQAIITLPKIVETTVPAVVSYTEQHNIDLPFADYAGAKAVTLATAKESLAGIGRHIRTAVFDFAQLLVGLVAAASLFLSARWGTESEPGTSPDSLYATVVRELAGRFQLFYASFSRVTGAQIIISVINTALTGGFLLWNDYPYKLVLVGLAFLCGLLPIIGNLVSNTLIVGVGFTLSPRMALVALIFLIIVHKLEYFLNSKIIGDRIKSPMWLMLIGLILGEELMGIPGLILAPVVLHYVKVEASRRKFSDPLRPAAAVNPPL
jgi:predicted PurR-regulated permease PerM